MMRIGIDVGGTNTDAVLMDGDRVVAWAKRPTSEDIAGGIEAALEALLEQAVSRAAGSADSVSAVMIGTTQFLNAVVEARRLSRTAVVRLGLPAGAALPPLVDWPDRLLAAVQPQVHQCHGGYEFDGRPISLLDEDEVRAAARAIAAAGIGSVAVSGVFASLNGEMERAAGALIAETAPGLDVSLSHEVGRLGLLERENATVLNASLRTLARTVVQGFRDAVRRVGLDVPVFVSQNDGTLMSLEVAEAYPVATFASGPTNSMRGASFLSGLDDCIVIDVGGTTTDVGVLVGGFPREASSAVEVNGVRTNFRMPDVLSVGLGGGSLVDLAEGFQVGPESVGNQLLERALVFGGDTLTATDVAVAGGRVVLGDASAVDHVPAALAAGVLRRVDALVGGAVDRVRLSGLPVPLVLVGGGSVLLGATLDGQELVRPAHFDVANAVGAAIAQVSGEVDRVVSFESDSRADCLRDARTDAVERAVRAGADPESVRVVDVDEVPLPYVPGQATRLRVRAVGDLDLVAGRTSV